MTNKNPVVVHPGANSTWNIYTFDNPRSAGVRFSLLDRHSCAKDVAKQLSKSESRPGVLFYNASGEPKTTYTNDSFWSPYNDDYKILDKAPIFVEQDENEWKVRIGQGQIITTYGSKTNALADAKGRTNRPGYVVSPEQGSFEARMNPKYWFKNVTIPRSP